MIKILITEFINQNSLDLLKDKFKVHYDDKLWKKTDELKEIINDCDGLIVRNKTQVNQDILKKTDNLKFVGRLGVGLDNIDTKFCEEKNIHVQPATGMNADSVVEYVASSSLSLIKKIPLFHTGTINGEWPRTSINSEEISGKTLGLIGYGTIGKKVSNYCSNLGLNIIAHDPYLKDQNNEQDVKFVKLDEIYNVSNIISLHLPLTDETRNLINKVSFSKMKQQPIIINTSRGSVINEDDLIEAYNNNLISGFALDVFENEPIKQEFYNKINDNMNCILTPHISGVTTQSNERVCNFIAEKTMEFFKNR
jgi:phosphoglycerate dehydrogenase-like enzyme